MVRMKTKLVVIVGNYSVQIVEKKTTDSLCSMYLVKLF